MSGETALSVFPRQELRRVEVFLRRFRQRGNRETSTRRSFAGPPGPAHLKQHYEGPVIRPFAVSGITKTHQEARVKDQQ
jgi:hypothetical protein